MLIELALIQWWCAVRWQGREKHSKLILSGTHITHFRSPHFSGLGCQKIEHILWDANITTPLYMIYTPRWSNFSVYSGTI